ncbi:MAG: phosphatase PAP2 family protein [Anaerolineales bacterium]
MTNSNPPPDDNANSPAQRVVRGTLREAVKQVQTPAQAEEALTEMEKAAGGQEAQDVARETPPPASEGEAARQVRRAVKAAPEAATERALTETARQVVSATGPEREAISEAAQAALNPEQQGERDTASQRPRQLLRDALLRRMKPYDAVDARFFLAINHLPHTPFINAWFSFLTVVFNGGYAWYGLAMTVWLWHRRLGGAALRGLTAPLALTTLLVEFPIKAYFRRKRPFIAIVQAIVIGRKPGTWSFPSGHSAAAFAGAWLLARYFQRASALLYGVAGLVAFSRIYLGNHYPGDVISGSLIGLGFARVFSWLQRRLFKITRPR